MKSYIIRRLLQSIIVILGVSIIVFFILHLTGDPAALLLPLDATQEDIDKFRHEMGFDDPIIVQYFRFLKNVLRGDFGKSLRHAQPAMGLVLERLPATIELTLFSLFLALLVSFPAGIISALKRSTIYDYVAMTFALIGQSIPIFWLGLMLILFFSVQLHLLPVSGRGGLSHLILPSLSIALYSSAALTRLIRSNFIEVMNADYIRTARAKGVSELKIVLKHALRNASIPVITMLGLQFATLLGGAVITETIFAWPGVGRLAIQAIYDRDYPLVQAVVFVVAFTFVVTNIIIDIIYTYLDPRIKYN